MDSTLHKVTISEEAKFDYEHCLIVLENPGEDDLPLFRFPNEIKAELEEYIQNHSKNKSKHYFRVRHYDEKMEDYLLLFVKRSWKMATMQNWTVVGICFEYDWDEELEEDGFYRNWYETKINDLAKDDWVEAKRIRAEMESLIAELEEIEEIEHEFKKQQEHDRRFGTKGTKRVQAQPKQVASRREWVKSELRILKERLRTAESKTDFH